MVKLPVAKEVIEMLILHNEIQFLSFNSRITRILVIIAKLDTLPRRDSEI